MKKVVPMPSRSKKKEADAIDAMMAICSDKPDQTASLKPSKQEVKMSRLTFELPQELHQRLKVGCAQEGIKMNALLAELIENRFPAKQ